MKASLQKVKHDAEAKESNERLLSMCTFLLLQPFKCAYRSYLTSGVAFIEGYPHVRGGLYRGVTTKARDEALRTKVK